MSKPKQNQEAPAELTLKGVATQIGAFEKGLGLSAAGLTRAERVKLRTGSEHVPDALIELLATHAEENGGTIAGISFDAAAAREALTYVSATKPAVTAARRFAQRAEDKARQQRGPVADRSFGIYRALERFVRTPEGESLKDAYEKMRSLVRPRRKAARTTKASATATEPKSTGADAGAAPTTAETPAAVVTDAKASV